MHIYFIFSVCTVNHLTAKICLMQNQLCEIWWKFMYCLFSFDPSWNKSKISWILWEKANNFHSCPSPCFSPNPFPKQSGVKLPLLSSGTSALVSFWSCWIPKLLNRGLSFHVGFLHMFCICVQYILVAKKWHFWMPKFSLFFFFLFLFSLAWSCMCSNFQGRKYPGARNKTINPLPKSNCHTAYNLSWHPCFFLL